MVLQSAALLDRRDTGVGMTEQLTSLSLRVHLQTRVTLNHAATEVALLIRMYNDQPQ